MRFLSLLSLLLLAECGSGSSSTLRSQVNHLIGLLLPACCCWRWRCGGISEGCNACSSDGGWERSRGATSGRVRRRAGTCCRAACRVVATAAAINLCRH